MLAKKYLRHPVFIAIGDRKGKANTNIEQRIEMIPEARKKTRLVEIVTSDEAPFIVFCNSKKMCDQLARHLGKQQLKCRSCLCLSPLLLVVGFFVLMCFAGLLFLDTSNVTNTVLHGGKIQETREANLEAFKVLRLVYCAIRFLILLLIAQAGAFTVLIATDVVGRGIDIPDVQQVINYEMPADIEKYQHRIGRTGRAGKTGIATSFVTDADTAIYFDLKAMLESVGMEVPAELARHEASKVKPGSVPDKPKRSSVIFAKR